MWSRPRATRHFERSGPAFLPLRSYGASVRAARNLLFRFLAVSMWGYQECQVASTAILSRSSDAQAEYSRERFLQLKEFQLAFVLGASAVGKRFLQQHQVAAELHLREH